MKKLITFILSVVLALSCGVAVVSFATTDNESTALEIGGLTADNFMGAGNGSFVYLDGFNSQDWVEQDKSYFTYFNAAGEDKLGRVTSYAGYLVINFQNDAAIEGDVVTICKGFTWGSKVLQQDVAFRYDGTAWVQGTPTRLALEITSLTATDNFYGAGAGTYVWLGANGEADWTAQNVSYFSYKNSEGEEILGRVVSYNQHLVINFQSTVASNGDIITIKQGFIWANKELKEDVSFKFNGTAWETYSATEPVTPEPDVPVELAALEIGGLTQDNFYGSGNGHYVYLGNIGDGWIEQEKSYFTYVNAAGEDKLGRVTSYAGYLVINFQNDAAIEGDVITIKQGFVWGDKELKQDVVFGFYKGSWIKGGVPNNIALGGINTDITQGDCFSIYLTDDSQTLTTSGWVGSDTTFALYASDWGYNFVNDIQKIYFVNGANKYNVRALQYYKGPGYRVLQVYFESGCDFANAKKGDMVCFDENFFINTNAEPVYTFGENGTYYYYDGTAWSKVTLATDAQISASSSVTVGATEKINYTFSKGVASPVISYSSSAEQVATVSTSGVIEGIAEGTATITVNFKGFSKTFDITVEKALEPVSLAIEITEEIYNENGALVAYVGENLDKNKLANVITAKYGYENNTFGSSFTITADNISFDGYDNTKAGKSAITVNYNGFVATLTVNVYEILSVNAPSSDNVDFWATAIQINFSSLSADFENVNWDAKDETLTKLGVADYVELKAASKNGGTIYGLHSVNWLYSRDIALTFENKGKNDLVKGDVLTFKKGLRMYKRVGTAYIALFELSSDFKVVWDGGDWVNFVAEAESIELSQTRLTLPVGAYKEIGYSILPANSYIKAKITSSNPEVVSISNNGTAIRVLKVSDTPVEISIQLGEDETTKKVISVTTVELEITGFDIYEKREYNVSLDEDLKLEYYYYDEIIPRKLMAVAIYSDGSEGEPFELVLGSNVVISNYDKTKAGSQNVTLTISNFGKEFDTQIVVKVKDSVAQVSDLLMQNPFGGAPLKFYISFAQTAKNEINISKNISNLYKLEDYIKFVRGDAEYAVEAEFNGQFLVVNAVFTDSVSENDRVYKLGDKFILEKGMPVLQWTGNASNYNAIGAGEYVIAGTVEYEIVFEHSDPVSKSWETYIQYVDIELTSETVEIGFGKLKDLGATMVPAYATVGEFTIVSSDPTIASVNANGLVKGEKIGTTTVTITLSGGEKGDVVKTVTVTVVDVISGIKFNKDKIYVDEGTVSLNAQLLADKGLKGVFVWASGKEEGEVDFSNAKFVGYSANKEGEQTITVRITVNGVSTTGKITVIVGKEHKGGCGSLVGAESAILALVAFAGVAVLKKKR